MHIHLLSFTVGYIIGMILQIIIIRPDPLKEWLMWQIIVLIVIDVIIAVVTYIW
jgi:hypothetical protein